MSICKSCGKKFDGKKRQQICEPCKRENKRIAALEYARRKNGVEEREEQCPICGTTFMTARAKKYCSEACGRVAQRRQDAERRKPTVKICEGCGQEFETPYQSTRFCSHACAAKFNGAKKSEKARAARMKRCEHCGKEFEAERKTARFCSVSCARLAAGERTREEKAQAETAKAAPPKAKARTRVENGWKITVLPPAEKREIKIKKRNLSEMGRIVEAARSAGMSYGQYVARTEGPMAAYMRRNPAERRAREMEAEAERLSRMAVIMHKADEKRARELLDEALMCRSAAAAERSAAK